MPSEKKTLGLYAKFKVERTDGSSAAGMKHDGCDYFVLDLVHDRHAVPALRAYADAAAKDGYQALAKDLRMRADEAVMSRIHMPDDFLRR